MQKRYILPLILISLFTIIALANLEAFPIFADEAIYLFWTQKIMQGIAHPLISLYDGKPPLFIWISGLFSLFSHNLLLTGRTVSVLAFGASLALIYINLEKSNRRLAYISLILAGLSPFVIFHSRLALIDSLFTLFLLAAVFVWTDQKLNHRGLMTGLMLGLAFWTKTPALFLLPFPLLSALIIERGKKNIKEAIYSLITALLVIGSLRVSIWFPFLFNRAGDFSFPLLSIFKGQTDQILRNFTNLLNWLISYHLWPLILASVFSVVLAIKQKNKLVLNLILAGICFVLPFIVLGKVISPRYYLFLGYLLAILAGFALNLLPKFWSWLTTGIIIITFIPFYFTLTTKPLLIKLPPVDKGQYLQDWSSGIGIREAAAFFVNEAKQKKVKVLSEGYFGTLPDGLFVEIGEKMQELDLSIDGVGENGSANYYKHLQNAKTDNIYYIGNHDRISSKTLDNFDLILSYPKVDGGPALEVYRIKR